MSRNSTAAIATMATAIRGGSFAAADWRRGRWREPRRWMVDSDMQEATTPASRGLRNVPRLSWSWDFRRYVHDDVDRRCRWQLVAMAACGNVVVVLTVSMDGKSLGERPSMDQTRWQQGSSTAREIACRLNTNLLRHDGTMSRS